MKIEAIKREIQGYYEMSFTNEQEDYDYNKLIKNKLKQLIVESKGNDQNLVEAALLVLAESTGCAEDQEIGEEIVEYLHEKKIIGNKQMNYFYDNVATGRWT